MTAFKNDKQSKKSSQERQAAAQRFLEDRLASLETIRDIVNAELDRRKEAFQTHANDVHRQPPAKRCKLEEWLDKLWE
ncbi:protein regulator of cytokinesis 1 [Alloprevotella tannerae]|uniref:protein regulator of cytokinesis 1 n=1 Tax=Alloprevotella tannerae TaxID=76122 RepID=UPI002889721A|nr:protein regulator of cytokinesis 1 [Alloprevotella tannerae]